MDPANILPIIERLDDAVENLDDALQPLAKNMTDVASRLPLLDKAKLYVLMTYSIESMLFSALRLNEVDAKEHLIFKELARVRQYFEKIKNIEFPPQKPEQRLNKEAAIRFLRSDLAENKEINTKLSEMIAKERAKAALKAKIGQKRKLDAAAPDEKSTEEPDSKESGNSGEGSEDEVEPATETQPQPKKSKKERKGGPERKGKKRKQDKKDKSKNEKKGKKSSKT